MKLLYSIKFLKIRYFNLCFALGSIFCNAQTLTVSENSSINILDNSSVSIAGLELAPSSTYVISGPNAFNRSSTPILMGDNTSINRVYTIITPLSDYLGTLNFRYEESELNGIPEADLVLEIQDTNEIWNNVTPFIDQTNNSLSYNFTEFIDFKSVTSSSVNNTLTVEPIKRGSFIKVYPNPTTDFIFIDSDLSYQSTIYNIIGQRVLRSNSKQLNVSNLPIGTYLLYLESETNSTLTFKIIKK